MSEKSLSEIWAQNASKRWQTDFDDLNREQSGAQGNRIHRFTGPESTFAGNSDKKKNDDDAAMQLAEIALTSSQRLSEQLITASNEAIEYYDQFDNELPDMKAELEDFITAYDKRTIHLSDGRRVYVDENGGYVYQDQYGAWNELEESATSEAKAKHQILGDQTITKEQKDNLDEYGAKLEYLEASGNQNKQAAQDYKEAAENGDLSDEQKKEGLEQIEKDRQEFEEMREDLKMGQQQIAQDLKEEPQLQKQKIAGNNRNNQMFGENLNTEQPPLTPPTIG